MMPAGATSGTPLWVLVLLWLAPLFQVGMLVIVGFLFHRLATGRLGTVGKAALTGLAAILAFTLPYVIGFTMAGQPLAVLYRALLVVAGIALVWFVLRTFPFPFPAWFSFFLESPVRRFFMPPDAVLDRLALGPGMTVVEVGPGPGVFTFALGARVQPGGRVVAADIQPKMVERIRRKAEKAGVDNVEPVVAPAHELPLDTQSAHLVLMVAVLGEIRNRDQALAEAYRVLIPGGLLVVSESWIDPHFQTRAELRRLATRAGFEEYALDGGALGYTAQFKKPGAYHWRQF